MYYSFIRALEVDIIFHSLLDWNITGHYHLRDFTIDMPRFEDYEWPRQGRWRVPCGTWVRTVYGSLGTDEDSECFEGKKF